MSGGTNGIVPRRSSSSSPNTTPREWAHRRGSNIPRTTAGEHIVAGQESIACIPRSSTVDVPSMDRLRKCRGSAGWKTMYPTLHVRNVASSRLESHAALIGIFHRRDPRATRLRRCLAASRRRSSSSRASSSSPSPSSSSVKRQASSVKRQAPSAKRQAPTLPRHGTAQGQRPTRSSVRSLVIRRAKSSAFFPHRSLAAGRPDPSGRSKVDGRTMLGVCSWFSSIVDHPSQPFHTTLTLKHPQALIRRGCGPFLSSLVTTTSHSRTRCDTAGNVHRLPDEAFGFRISEKKDLSRAHQVSHLTPFPLTPTSCQQPCLIVVHVEPRDRCCVPPTSTTCSLGNPFVSAG
jgi:hypothetical protein